MSISNMASYTQTFPQQQSYPLHSTYTQHGQTQSQQQQQQQQQQPRLMYFITRSNGTIVPLVPTDELPYTVRLEGAPRNLAPEQTFGMQFLGSLPYTGTFFKAKHEVPAMQRSTSQPETPLHHRQYSNEKKYMAPDALARQAATNAAHHSHNLSNTNAAATAMIGRTYDPTSASRDARQAPTPSLTDPQAIIDAIVSSKSGAETAARVGYIPKSASPATTPSGKIPDANKKTHCSYWIRTGECDYAQQGCMYKHEMPDEKGLLELGFRSTPRWWVEKNQAIRLGGGGSGGKMATVGPVVKPSEWLRKESVASTASVESSDSSAETEGTGKAEEEKNMVQSSKATAVAESVPTQQKKITILKKPIEQIVGSPATSTTTSADHNPIKAKSQTDSGDLIDFGSSEPSSSTASASTPPTSLDGSPGASPTLQSSMAAGATKAKEIFVPKGESKTQHLADHATRQHRSASSRRPKPSQVPSQAQIASLEKQIQQAQKSKHLASVGQSGGAGMMASKHAPARGGKHEGKRDGRSATGLRVRRPALQCVEIPTGKKVKEKAGVEGKGSEKGSTSAEAKVEKK